MNVNGVLAEREGVKGEEEVGWGLTMSQAKHHWPCVSKRSSSQNQQFKYRYLPAIVASIINYDLGNLLMNISLDFDLGVVALLLKAEFGFTRQKKGLACMDGHRGSTENNKFCHTEVLTANLLTGNYRQHVDGKFLGN